MIKNYVEKVKKAAHLLRTNDNYCFLCHKNLDGDAFGACYALKYALEQIGKNSVVRTYGGEFVEKFADLCLVEKVDCCNFNVENYVTVDVADLSLLEQEFLKTEIFLCIDHHKTNRINAKFSCLDFSAAACCEIIYNILKELNVKMTKQIANCLYLGVASDSGCFKFENTTAKTHRIAADLIEKGADFAEINFKIFDCKTVEKLNLEREIIENLQFYFNGIVAIVFVTEQIIKKTNATKEDCSSVSNIAAGIEKVLVAITAKQEGFFFKISVRSKKGFDASLFCKRFDGGGHERAAGCLIKGEKEFVLEKLIDALKEEL